LLIKLKVIIIIKKSSFIIKIKIFRFLIKPIKKQTKFLDMNESIQNQFRKPFNPIEHGLEASWRLTNFSELKG
jgi:hypothetical protein